MLQHLKGHIAFTTQISCSLLLNMGPAARKYVVSPDIIQMKTAYELVEKLV